MTQVGLARIARLVARIAEIALGHHPKRADRRERPAVVAVEFVPMVAIEHDLTLETAGQFETVEEHVARIRVSFAKVVITLANIITITKISLFAIQPRTVTQFD